MSEAKLKNAIIAKLTAYMEEELLDELFWEDDIEEGHLSEEDVNAIIVEMIPNCEISLKLG